MIRLRHKLMIKMLRLYDQWVMASAIFAILYAGNELNIYSDRKKCIYNVDFNIEDAFGMMVLAAGWIGIFDHYVCYKSNRLTALSSQVYCLLKAVALASFWLMLVCAVFSIDGVSIPNVFIFFGVVISMVIISRIILRMLLVRARKSGYNYRNLLVIGVNERAIKIAEQISQQSELGYKVLGFVAESVELDAINVYPCKIFGDHRILGHIDEIRMILSNEQVDEIIICLPREVSFGDITRIILQARDLGIVVRVMPDLQEGSLLRNIHLDQFNNEYVITLFRERLIVQLLIKRLVDVILSFILLVLLFPLLCIVSAIIKLNSPGPVFFIQTRVGMNQRKFRMYKFRSMIEDAEVKKLALVHLNDRDGPVFKIFSDPRITSVGIILRKFSIDEIPQLFNVLCGEMSLVGPRPPLAEEVAKYDWRYRKRLSVKPGITCLWQISGRNNISFHQWMQMDHEYIENWSLLLDLKILIMTIPAVLLSKGAS